MQMSLGRAADSLRFVYDNLTRSMKSEWELAESFEHLEKIADGLLETVRWTELANGLKEKQDLLQATKVIEDFVVDLLRDIGLVKVQKELVTKGMTEAAQYTGLASFAIDYGYQSARFYVAWENVHDVLSQIADRNAVRDTLGRKITETTNQINAVRAEVRRAKQAEGNKDESEQILAQMRQEELHEAYLAGEWFSSRSGIRAPGEPISDDKH